MVSPAIHVAFSAAYKIALAASLRRLRHMRQPYRTQHPRHKPTLICQPSEYISAILPASTGTHRAWLNCLWSWI